MTQTCKRDPNFVKVVRCIDCIHNTLNTDGVAESWCYKHGIDVEGDDYCSYGEKQEVDAPTNTPTDLISRQDALKPFCIAPDGTSIPEVDCDNFPVEFSAEFIKKHLLSLPSAADAVSREEYEETDGVIKIKKQSANDVGEIKHIVVCSPNYTRYFYNDSMPTPYKGGDDMRGEADGV